MTFRFLHSSDLHLGKPFGGFPEDVRGRLRQARQEAIPRLAKAARDNGARHIVLAGDTFDAETPAPQTLRHAINAMAAADDLIWVLMPGNHDHLGAKTIWDELARNAPPNLVRALSPEPITLQQGVCLLPAPCTVRDPGRDLTEWMDHAETNGAIRIGLAHGSIRDFRSAAEMGGEGSAVIAPDRAARAGLDYFGLGDWHGRIEVTPNSWYSGTPEPDSFKPHRPAGALLVEIEAHRAPPRVSELATGQLDWQRVELALFEGEDPAARFNAALPDRAARANTLLSAAISGRASLAERAALEAAIDAAQPDFLWADSDLTALHAAPSVEDLSLIDAQGAVRDTANALSEAALAGDEVAAAALSRLYAYALEAE